MIKARRSTSGSSRLNRYPLVALLAATSIATALACGSDDGDGDNADDASEESLALEGIEPVEIPERPPAEAITPAAPPAGSDTPNGLSVPASLADWSVIGVVRVLPTETPASPGTVRVVLGNDTAVTAARAGQTNPWPDGSMIGHLQWAPGSEPASGTAVTTGAFAAATVMMKDADEFAADGGWAYGVWRGLDLVPPGAAVAPAPEFDRACVACHTAEVPDQDYVFTIPGALPTQAEINNAAAQPNGVEMPAGILGWRVIGIASRENDPNPSIRVIVGNDIAVDAARSGDTDPWPDGAMLAHYVWAPGDNPDAPGTVTPVAFNAITLMVKDAAAYEEDGGWAYGAWATAALNPLAAGADQDCVNCHVSSVADTDYVFTRPGALPDLLTGNTPTAP
jgi:hypothetical protein